MRFEQLFYFETLLQEGSYNKAATKLHITQPALTSSIKNMEKELNVTLLTRDTRGINLTEEGKIVLEFAKSIMQQYYELSDKLHPQETDYSGNVSILASLFITEIVLEEFLSAFRTKYKDIVVRLFENEIQTSSQHLATTTCNFAIVSRLTADDESKCTPGMIFTDEEIINDQFIYLPLFQDTFGICMARKNTLSDVRDLYPIDTFNKTQPITTFRLGVLTADSLSSRLMLSSNNTKLHINTMNDTGAICSLPYFVYKRHFAEEPSIIWRPFSNNITITYYLIYRSDQQLSVAEQIFMEELRHYLTQLKFT